MLIICVVQDAGIGMRLFQRIKPEIISEAVVE